MNGRRQLTPCLTFKERWSKIDLEIGKDHLVMFELPRQLEDEEARGLQREVVGEKVESNFRHKWQSLMKPPTFSMQNLWLQEAAYNKDCALGSSFSMAITCSKNVESKR